MTNGNRFLGVSELADEVSQALARAPLSRIYPQRAALVQAVGRVIDDYLSRRLEPLSLEHRIWQGPREMDAEGIEPVYAFGTTFTPDLEVEIAGRPTLALTVRQVRGDPAPQIRASIGEAVVYSRRYPAVIAFLHGSRRGEGFHHLLDREITMSLWTTWKIRLVVQ